MLKFYNRAVKLKITVTDIVILICAAVFCIFIAFLLWQSAGSSFVEIKTPYGKYVYPLSENAVYEFDGTDGKSVISIQDGKVRFVKSPCPGKNCIAVGEISKPGAFNACLPNGISVTITGGSEVDAVSI